jgi:hypothetical protein
MSDYKFEINSMNFSIEDLGQAMNEQFRSLYVYYFANGSFDREIFEIQSHTYFDNFRSINDHDRYFNNLTPLWLILLQRGLFTHAEQVWEIVTEAAARWEKLNHNDKIHKGAGFYFWGITCILKEDLEKGFLLMHQAVEEDIRNPIPDPKCTPAYSFVSLDYNQQNQLFRNKVLELAEFVEEKLTTYKAERNGKLTMADFRTRILQNPDLVEQVFLFVYELFHLKKMLAENKRGLTKNTYGSMLMVQSIFTFTLIIDNLIKEKHNNQDSHKQQFMHLLVFLSQKAKLNMDESKLKAINGMFTRDFQGTFEKLMNSQPLFKSRFSATEEDIAISYGFRNSAAHKIKNRGYIHAMFNDIVNRIFYLFFFAIEKLYI